MFYINFKLLEAKGCSLEDFNNLQIIFQNKTEDLQEVLEKRILQSLYDNYEEKGLIKFNKQKNKSESIHNRVRLTPKGSDLLEDLQIPEINEDDISLYNWLENIYTSEEKEIGNRKKTKLYIALFRVSSGIDRHKLTLLCKSFMRDESQFQYSIRLEYLFWKPANVFSTKFDIEQSRLYQYYIKNKRLFDSKFETL